MWSCGWAAAVFLCERRSDPPELELGRLDIGTSLLKGHTLSRHYHSLKPKKEKTKHLQNVIMSLVLKWTQPKLTCWVYLEIYSIIHNLNLWFKPLVYLRQKGDQLILFSPNLFIKMQTKSNQKTTNQSHH